MSIFRAYTHWFTTLCIQKIYHSKLIVCMYSINVFVSLLWITSFQKYCLQLRQCFPPHATEWKRVFRKQMDRRQLCIFYFLFGVRIIQKSKISIYVIMDTNVCGVHAWVCIYIFRILVSPKDNNRFHFLLKFRYIQKTDSKTSETRKTYGSRDFNISYFQADIYSKNTVFKINDKIYILFVFNLPLKTPRI